MFWISAFLLLVSFNGLTIISRKLNKEVYPDTSFTLFSTAKRVQNDYPFARLVGLKASPNVEIRENIVYTKYGERELHLDIYSPSRKEKKYPTVIIIHGGGWRSGNKEMEKPIAMELAAKGYIAVLVEYRLSGEAKYPAAIYDLKSAISWVKANSKNYKINTNKIAVMGMSAGGMLAAYLGTTGNSKKLERVGGKTKFSSKVHAIIDIDGVLDMTHPAESGKDTISTKPSAGKLWLGYSYKENPELWQQASPINYVDKNTPPMLFINSSIQRFHAGRDEAIEILKKNKIYYEVHTIENTPHPFWLFNPWFNDVINHTINFLNKVFR